MKNKKIRKEAIVKNSYIGLILIASTMFFINFFYGFRHENRNLLVSCTLFLIAYYSACELYRHRRKLRYLNSSLSDLDKLDGIEFEEYCKTMFEKRGYKARTTPKSHDFGADLVLEKDGIVTVVQAKRYKGIVGIAAVQQAIGSMKYYGASKCMVITTNYFTDAAKELARANDVTLYDRNFLLSVTKNGERNR